MSEEERSCCPVRTLSTALVVEPAGNLWGSERALLDLLSPLSRTVPHLSVCCPPRSSILTPLSMLPVKIFPTFVGNSHMKGRLARARSAGAVTLAGLQARPQLVHVNQAGATRVVLVTQRLLGVPVIVHARLVEDAGYLASLGSGGERVAKILAVSRYLRDELVSHLSPRMAERVTPMYDPYKPVGDWNRPLAPTPPFPLFVCVGRLAQTKGQDLAVRAVADLVAAGGQARMLILGTTGPADVFDRVLRDLASRLGVSERVEFRGFSPTVIEGLAGATGLLCPSHAEPLGRVIFEAWDAGVVPVAWRGSGGPAEIIEASDAGLLYNEQRPEAIAAALLASAQLPYERRCEMIARGRAWMLAHVDPDRCAEGVAELWTEAIR